MKYHKALLIGQGFISVGCVCLLRSSDCGKGLSRYVAHNDHKETDDAGEERIVVATINVEGKLK